MWNMDELGHETWSDARDTIFFVSSDLPDRRVHYPVPPTGKRITLIACISVDGSYMRPVLVISRKTTEDEFFLYGFASEKVEIYSQTKPCIDSDIFADWFRKTFIPDLAARREQYRFFGPRY
jgi:hypothetical protein